MALEIVNYDKTKKSLIVDFDYDSFALEDKDNSYSISFTTISDVKNKDYAYDLIQNENSVFYNGQEFVIKQCKELAKGDLRAKEVTAVHITYNIQYDFRYDSISGTKSLNECLDYIFRANTQGFKYEVIHNENNVTGRKEYENFGSDNLLKLIEKVMDDFDVALVRDNKLFTFIPNRFFENQTNNQIRYLYNTDDVSFDIDTYDLRTQIRGYGKRKNEEDGGGYYFEPFNYTSPEAEKWGIRIQDSINDERYTIRSNMIERLKKELKDYPSVHGEVSMKELDFEVKRGDLVRFVYEPLGINRFIKVVGVTYYPFSNKPPTVELDNNKKTMIDYIAVLMRGGNK